MRVRSLTKYNFFGIIKIKNAFLPIGKTRTDRVDFYKKI